MKNKTLCQLLGVVVEIHSPFVVQYNGKDIYREYYDGTWWLTEKANIKVKKDDPFIIAHNSKVVYREYLGGFWERAVHDSSGNEAYYENSYGDRRTYVYDSNSALIYYEDSDGYIIDTRPKEVALDEVAEKFNVPVERLKIKK